MNQVERPVDYRPYVFAMIRHNLIEAGADPQLVARISTSLLSARALGRAIKAALGLPAGEIDVASNEARQPDNINHPPHYNSHPSGIECIEVVEHFGFNVGNAIKYLWRAGLKTDAIEDLRKARWYVEREIARVSAEVSRG